MTTFRQKVQATTDWGKPDPSEAAQMSGDRAGERAGNRASRPRRSAQPPITAHRLFPVLAALWFAALFGLGSLAISGAVLGTLVTAIGLPALVPAAAPPLGFTAHALVAFALTMLGGGFGLLLGLRLRPASAGSAAVPRSATTAAPTAAPGATNREDPGAVPKVRARDAHPDAPPRRPLVLTEAFGDPQAPVMAEPVDPAAPLLRRKPGQTLVDAAAADPFASSTPAPWIPVYTPGGAAAAEPLDLAALDLAELELAEPLDLADVGEALAPASFVAPFAAPVDASASAPEPLEDAGQDLPPEPAPPRPVLIAATPQGPGGFTFPQPDPDDALAGQPRSPVAGAPIESLGLVQLVERLALAIAARKAANDAAPPPPATAIDDLAQADADIPASDPAPELSAMPPASGHPGETPGYGEPLGSARAAIMRRLGVAAARDTAEPAPAPFSRPTGALAQAPEAASVPAPLSRLPLAEVSVLVQPEQTPGSGGQAGPFAAPAARSAAPAPTPATAPAPATAETDEALRSALATLQRMTARG